LLLAGVLLGAATAVKWSGLFAIAAFGLWVVVVETLRIRTAHRGKIFVRRSALAALRSFALFVPVALVVYIASWSGWILSAGGYSRSWAADAGYGDGLFGVARALWKYHRDIYIYNIGLNSTHSYQADPFRLARDDSTNSVLLRTDRIRRVYPNTSPVSPTPSSGGLAHSRSSS